MAEPTRTEVDGGAVVALVFGVLGFLMLPLIGPILALCYGSAAQRRIRATPALTGSGLARAGMILARTWIALVGLALVLVGIGIPTFLGARKRAEDRAAQTSLRSTLTAAVALHDAKGSYKAATPVALHSDEPALTFVAADDASSDPTTVSVAAADPRSFVAAVSSDAGNCWYIRDNVGGGGVTWNVARSDGADCSAELVPTSGWTPVPQP